MARSQIVIHASFYNRACVHDFTPLREYILIKLTPQILHMEVLDSTRFGGQLIKGQGHKCIHCNTKYLCR